MMRRSILYPSGNTVAFPLLVLYPSGNAVALPLFILLPNENPLSVAEVNGFGEASQLNGKINKAASAPTVCADFPH
jgi:hypothetical protein